jgi:hypothetical protein
MTLIDENIELDFSANEVIDSGVVPFEPENDTLYGVNTSWFAEQAERLATESDFLEECIPQIIQIDEQSFVETNARLYLLQEGAAKAIGMLMWMRLREQFGFEKARESKERNQQIWVWAAKINENDDTLEYRLKKWINFAMARQLDPSTDQLSPTAGNEITMGIEGDDEELVKDTIENRMDAVESLDPLLETPTNTLRDVKVLAKNGNLAPSVIRIRANNTEPVYREYTFLASIKTGQKPDENGALVDETELFPVMSVNFEMPASEELRPQFEDWKKVMLRKLGGKVREDNNGDYIDASKNADDD